jgi:hypothetical protein
MILASETVNRIDEDFFFLKEVHVLKVQAFNGRGLGEGGDFHHKC